MKRIKYLIFIIVLSLIIVFGVSYSYNGKIVEYKNEDFITSYDSTWKVTEKKNGLKLKHKKTDSVLEIQCKTLDSSYMDTKLSDIISDIIYGIEQQNIGYSLINRLSNPSDEYESYSYLYESGNEQALVNIYKKDNKVIIIYYCAKSDVFDIVLDSVDNILDSLKIITGESIK